jgi:signal transduction histidine kinase
MDRMIKELLDYRLLSGDGIRLERVPSDLRDHAARSIEEVAASHPDAPIKLDVEPGVFLASIDPDRMAQVFGNLLRNAIQHGGRQTTIHVALRHAGAHLEVSVANNGPPIPEELLPHVFEPFRRGTHGGGEKGSLGLGLFIVQRIVRAHGGTVEARSSAREGTRVTFRVPALAASEAAEVRRTT